MPAAQDQRLGALQPFFAQVVDVVDEYDGVVHGKSRKNDDAKIGTLIQRRAGQVEDNECAHKAAGHRQQDRERLDEGLRDRRHDQVDQGDGQEDGEEELTLGFPHHGEVAPHAPRVARREFHPVHHLRHLGVDPSRSGTRGVAAHFHLRFPVLSPDRVRALLAGETGQIPHGDHAAPGPLEGHVLQLAHIGPVFLLQLQQDVHLAVFGLELAPGSATEGRLYGAGGLPRRDTVCLGHGPVDLNLYLLVAPFQAGVHVFETVDHFHPVADVFGQGGKHRDVVTAQFDFHARAVTAPAAHPSWPPSNTGDLWQRGGDLRLDLVDRLLSLLRRRQHDAQIGPAQASVGRYRLDVEFILSIQKELFDVGEDFPDVLDAVAAGKVRGNTDIPGRRRGLEFRLDVLVQPVTAEEDRRERYHRDQAVAQVPGQYRGVQVGQARKEARRLAERPREKPGRDHWDERKRDEHRRHHDDAEGDDEVLHEEHEPAASAKEDERQENAEGRCRRCNDGHGNLPRPHHGRQPR